MQIKDEVEFPYDLTVKTYDAGMGNVMRLNCILKYQQQAGEEQLELHNIGFDRIYEKLGLVWVVTNASVIVNRIPRYGEKLRLITWNRGAKGAKFFRSYNWYSENDELLIEGSTAFVLVDVREHKAQRPNDEAFRMPCDFNRVNAVKTPGKIFLPDREDFSPIGEKTIVYSLIDQNGHLNNAFYTDFITDFCTEEENRRIRAYSLDYIAEARLGDTVRVYRAQKDGVTYFYGEHERGMCFRAKCEYRANSAE